MKHLLVVTFVLALLPLSVRADVKHVAPNGFVTFTAVTVAASPDRVYRALVGDVGSWWNPQHSYSGDGKNLSIDARPGGCFCEKLPGGGGVEHLRVIVAKPGETLRLSGALGPLQSSALAGTMTWSLAATGSATTLTVTYSVGGFREGGLEGIAPAVDGVVAEQVQRLKKFIETGKPDA